MSLFKNHTQEDHRKSLADFLPNGDAFGSKNDQGSDLFNFLCGLAVELMREEGDFNLLTDEQDLRYTTLLIERWEEALGIPDGCFPGTGSLEERRLHVRLKLSLAIDNRESFVALANALGFRCVINGGSFYGRYPLRYPWRYFSGPKSANFTMYVHLDNAKAPQVYPFTIPKYPWPYSGGTYNIIECLFRKLRPANVQIIFIYDL